MNLFLLMVKYVLIFKISILILSFNYSQDYIEFPLFNNIEIDDSLNFILKKENNLTGLYRIDQYNILDSTITYRYYDEIKKLDTLFVVGLDQVSDKIKNKLSEEYKNYSIGRNFEKIGNKIMLDNYFIKRNPNYIIGFTEAKKLGAIIYFQPQFNSHFSGYFGINKNEIGFNINGEINFHLENLTKSTGIIDINWKRIDSLSQHINLSIYEPYILNSNLGLNWSYYHAIINGLYTNIENKLKFNLSSSLLSNFNLGYLKGIIRPTYKGRRNNYKNVKYEGFSLSFNRNLLNNRFLPTEGYLISLDTDLGLNNDFIYIDGKISFNNYFRVKNRFYSTYKWIGEGIKIFNSKVPKSRYKYFGGVSSLRGYNNNQFKSTQYSISSFEFGYVFNSNLHGIFFSDIGSKKLKIIRNDNISYGIGLKKINENIILNIEYAFSRDIVLLSKGKLHIQIISRF